LFLPLPIRGAAQKLADAVLEQTAIDLHGQAFPALRTASTRPTNQLDKRKYDILCKNVLLLTSYDY
jgi:hypothetical protein